MYSKQSKLASEKDVQDQLDTIYFQLDTCRLLVRNNFFVYQTFFNNIEEMSFQPFRCLLIYCSDRPALDIETYY